MFITFSVVYAKLAVDSCGGLTLSMSTLYSVHAMALV